MICQEKLMNNVQTWSCENMFFLGFYFKQTLTLIRNCTINANWHILFWLLTTDWTQNHSNKLLWFVPQSVNNFHRWYTTNCPVVIYRSMLSQREIKVSGVINLCIYSCSIWKQITVFVSMSSPALCSSHGSQLKENMSPPHKELAHITAQIAYYIKI